MSATDMYMYSDVFKHVQLRCAVKIARAAPTVVMWRGGDVVT